MSKVFCVVPTHNRLLKLKKCIDCLYHQIYSNWELIVVDDGSSDRTADYIETLDPTKIKILKGDGSLWWAGSMRLGMEYVIKNSAKNDYLLMLNDDVEFNHHFLSDLIIDARTFPDSIIGVMQKSSENDNHLYNGFTVDYLRLEISYSNQNISALPGRGMLIPIQIIRVIGLVNSFLFPHFMADLEFSARANDRGFQLVSSTKAFIRSDPQKSDAEIQRKGIFSSLFHLRSRRNIFFRILFFSLRGPVVLRILAIPRYFLIRSFKLIKLVTYRLSGKVA